LRVEHLDHEFDDGPWGEELADLTAEGPSEEALEGDALDGSAIEVDFTILS
jgi:hypothetical protein